MHGAKFQAVGITIFNFHPLFVSFSPVIYGMSGLLEYTLSHFNNGKGTSIKDIINGTDLKIDILS